MKLANEYWLLNYHESAIEYGFTVEDYDYLNMPQIGATTLIITVTTDKAEITMELYLNQNDDGDDMEI